VTSGQKHDRLDSERSKTAAGPILTPRLSKAQNLHLKELRRLDLQRRATHLADQEHADFETRFMGYAH
jgi:hypothetical protein